MDQNLSQNNNDQEYQNNLPDNSGDGKPDSRNGRSGFWGGIFTGILLSLLVAASAFVVRQVYTVYQAKEARETIQEDQKDDIINEQSLSKLRALEQTIRNYYYKSDEVDIGQMEEGMYDGLLSSLGDPYSVYYSEEDLNALMEQTKGIYYGIGAYVGQEKDTGYTRISGVIDGTPAQDAGLRDGDIIYMVDDQSVQGMQSSDVVSLIKGLEGTTVHLTIVREGESDYLEFDIERKKIESPTVNHEMYDNGIGYLQITEFDDVTLDQFTEAMAELRGQGMKGLIIDVRANPGGNLNTVTDIARQLLPEGLIVYTEDRDGKRTEYTCDGTKEFDMPLVVLINGYSASASEILAGAVKDYGIGELIGTTSYGKGIVQRVISMTDGTAVKLTVSAYFTPNGNNIHGIGIEPDEVYEFDSERYYKEGYDNQLERAKEVVAEKIAAEGN